MLKHVILWTLKSELSEAEKQSARENTKAQLEALARAQNKVSDIMWEMMKQPYFESENMQELWTVMTHHYARRSAGAR